MKKKFLIFAGAIFSIFNVLPIPWPLRLLWFKFLYSITLTSTLLFTSIIRWTRAQNMIYKKGKQEGEAYESIVQLEMVVVGEQQRLGHGHPGWEKGPNQ